MHVTNTPETNALDEFLFLITGFHSDQKRYNSHSRSSTNNKTHVPTWQRCSQECYDDVNFRIHASTLTKSVCIYRWERFKCDVRVFWIRRNVVSVFVHVALCGLIRKQCEKRKTRNKTVFSYEHTLRSTNRVRCTYILLVNILSCRLSFFGEKKHVSFRFNTYQWRWICINPHASYKQRTNTNTTKYAYTDTTIINPLDCIPVLRFGLH